MEQRTGASSKPSKAEPLKTEPVTGAGFDPAFIPGLTAPAKSDASASPEQEPVEPEEPGKAVETEASAGPEEPAATAGEPEEAEEADEAADDDGGPVFEASDRRARIVADRKGVRLRLDEESCEFRWDEIAAVETESPRFGKRYTITVHTPDRRWYPIEIEATAKSLFKEWDEQIDAVLDAYFEEGEKAEQGD
ncbi:hypothetical protein A6P39_017220 [Streptomyces sp. FXJ1.172]|uniref:hypothetical protein n=1 Tax=Streptomyces sp. FXJ1.172 TaxID=710705 RepID=UPI0007CF63D7|nr:hypothetical protein [Streptomyces sp. FXJ1.172]WEO95623.1 hypothetical protein A6P39_017220 [Streptomyces sp. FXJ1.172]